MGRISKFGRRVAVGQPRRSLVESLESRTLLNAADLDTTFGSGGIATTQFNGFGLSSAQAVAVQGDGKLVAAGYSASNNVITQVAVARYNTNGTLDSTFGTGGTMQFAIGQFARANAVALQTDGKIVVAGNYQPNPSTVQFMVARLNTNGTLDTTFNTTGYETFNVNQSLDVANCVAIQGNGKIVVGGQDFGGISDFALARLNANGGLDTTFGSGGLVATNVNSKNSHANACNALTIDSTGHIDAAGAIGTNNQSATAMGFVQYSSTGSVDFVAQAPVVASSGDSGTSIAVQSDGNILVGGAANGSIAVVRFNAFGSADQTFANLGVFTYTANTGTARSLNLMSSGNIVLGGTTSGNPSTSAFLLRLTSAGALDTTFNSTGSLLFGSHFSVFASAVRSTGAIVVAGNVTPPNNMNVQQFTSAGAADTTFGSGAPVSTDFIDPVQTVGRSAALQTDGKLVVGSVYFQSETTARRQQAAITRYNVDGTIDATFGASGSVFVTSGAFCDLVGVVVQPNGDIVMEASVEDPTLTSESVLLERFLPTGAPDTTFGVGGQRVLNSAAGYATFISASALAMQPDGSLYVLSITGSFTGATITRLTPNGQFDTTYGTAGTGVVTTSTVWTTETVDSSGRLVVGAQQSAGRYLSNGTLDTTFQTPSISTNATAGSVITQPDGKVLISSSSGAKVERYTATGAVDGTFGQNNGLATTSINANFGVGALLSNGDILAGGLITLAGSNPQGVICAYNSYGIPITTFGTNGSASYSAIAATDAIVARGNGRVLIIGQSTDGKESVTQLVGNPPNVIQASPGNETINLSRSGDGLSINWTLGASSGSILASDPAGLTINGDAANDTITLAANNALPTILHLNGTFTLNGLTGADPFAGNALDIDASTVFIPYAGLAADPLSNIRGDIKTGFNNGLWNHIPFVSTGIIGSTAAEGSTPRNTAVGYADSADGLVSLPANTIELKYTLYGDTGLTGSVGFTDFMRMTQHYTLTGQTWGKGDFNYDGTIDSNDFNLLQPNYGQTLPAPAPEPAPVMTPIFAAPTTPVLLPVTGVDPTPVSSPGDSTGAGGTTPAGSGKTKLKTRASKPHQKHR